MNEREITEDDWQKAATMMGDTNPEMDPELVKQRITALRANLAYKYAKDLVKHNRAANAKKRKVAADKSSRRAKNKQARASRKRNR